MKQENYTFSSIAKLYGKPYSFIDKNYKKGIKLFKENKIKKDIRTLVFYGLHYINCRKYNTNIILSKNLNKFRKLIDEIIQFDCRLAENLVTEKYFWGKDSIYCYKIGCNCSKCDIAENYPTLLSECQMKKRVLELVRLYGVPKDDNI